MTNETLDSVVLKPMQQRFVDEYLVDLNATQSAIRAGYSEKTAYSQGQRLLKNVEIDSLVKQRIGDRVGRTEVDQDYVIKIIVETIERCSQAKPVYDRSGELVMVETPTGDIAPVYKYDSASVLKGAELLGKHLAMFTDKVDHTTNGKEIKSGLGHFYGRGNNDGDSDT